MMRAALLTILLCLDVSPAAYQATAAQLGYTLYVVGLPVADAVLSVDLTAPAYRVTMDFHTTGLADLVVRDHLEETISGRFEGDRPVPLEYRFNSHFHGQDRAVGMTWHDGTPAVTAITPPNGSEREDVPRASRARTIDPLSAFTSLLHKAARTGRCDDTARTFDGRVLQQFEMKTAGEEELPPSGRSSFSGRALRCEFTSQTFAGFRFLAGRDDDLRTHRGTIWLSQVLPGTPRLPVRAAVETWWFGDAVIYLTSAAP
jgi:hypothetical protein